jgi:hypothetical protein
VSTQPAAQSLTGEEHRRLAADLFNQVWSLIETPDRTPEQTDAMIHAAHASRHHWSHASGAGPENLARGEWQCSRVYAVLGRGEPALWHARRVLEICQSNGIGDWDLAFAYEALARANTVSGNREQAEHYVLLARDAGEKVAEDEDRELLFSDLATIEKS